MTAAIAAKFVRTPPLGAERPESHTRLIFWLLVASVNFPDLDVVMAAFRDPFLSIKTHRWITHSVLFIPVFAIIPAAVFYRFGSLKNFRFLWLVAQLGILIHIVCDLVTPYGTQLLAPFSTHRYTLSSLFIVDLYFSGGLIVLLLLGRYDARRKKIWKIVGLVFGVGFLAVTFCVQKYADIQVHRAAAGRHIAFMKISTLPQPLSIFQWIGLVQTKAGIHRAFFSVFDNQLTFEDLPHAEDTFVAKGRQTDPARWYLDFAHHPLILSFKRDQNQIVEIHDLQFSAPPKLIKALNLKRTSPPFTLRFTYNATGELQKTEFNEP